MQISRPEPFVCRHDEKTAPTGGVSVIIPVFNGGSAFIKCLDSVLCCTPPPLEIIVVADGESDGSWRYAISKEIRPLLLENRGGPAHARNEGARIARGDILLFLDADVIVKPDIICQVADFFARNPLYAAVIGSYDDCPTEQDIVSQYRNLLHHFVHQHSLEAAKTFWGACGAIKRADFLSVGGFDHHYRTASIEDIELGYRLVKGGYHIRLAKDLQITHQKRWGLFNMIHTDIYKRALRFSGFFPRPWYFYRLPVAEFCSPPTAVFTSFWQRKEEPFSLAVFFHCTGSISYTADCPLLRPFSRKKPSLPGRKQGYYQGILNDRENKGTHHRSRSGRLVGRPGAHQE
jgi:GT2 family glycosyltransferase